MINIKELKSKFIELLKSDEEFRLMVAGFIGLDRVLYELKKLREDFNKLYQKSLEHNKRFEEIEKKLLEHDKRFEAIEKKLLEHTDRFEGIERILYDHGRRLSRIELEIGALNESFYCKTLLDELMREFSECGERTISWKRNARVDDEDIDLLIVTDKRVYVVEVKVKPKHEDEDRLLAKADVVKKHYKDKEVVAILAGSMIGREIEEYANEKNVLVYSY